MKGTAGSKEQTPDLPMLRKKLVAATTRRDDLRQRADRISDLLSASGERRAGLASLCADDLASVQDLASVEAEVDELQREIRG